MKMAPMRILLFVMLIIILIGFIPWINFVFDTGRFPNAHEVFNWEFNTR